MNAMNYRTTSAVLFVAAISVWVGSALAQLPEQAGTAHRGALAGERHRVLVSTDIGGTDPDDFQSLVHLLVYADVLDIEGLVSSPFDAGRTKDILDVVNCYEKDYGNLKTHSDRYPSPAALRAITSRVKRKWRPTLACDAAPKVPSGL